MLLLECRFSLVGSLLKLLLVLLLLLLLLLLYLLILCYLFIRLLALFFLSLPSFLFPIASLTRCIRVSVYSRILGYAIIEFVFAFYSKELENVPSLYVFYYYTLKMVRCYSMRECCVENRGECFCLNNIKYTRSVCTVFLRLYPRFYLVLSNALTFLVCHCVCFSAIVLCLSIYFNVVYPIRFYVRLCCCLGSCFCFHSFCISLNTRAIRRYIYILFVCYSGAAAAAAASVALAVIVVVVSA